MEIFLARQPIFDRKEHLAGYAVCYADVDGAKADERKLLDACLDHGFDQIAEGQPALIPVSPALIQDGAVRVVHPQRVILRLTHSATLTPELVKACEALATDGYRFAFAHAHAMQEPALLKLARIVTLNVGTLDADALGRIASYITRSGARIMAEHVPDRSVRDRCNAAGFDLFQLSRFQQQEVLAAHDVGVDQAQAFRLLSVIRDQKASDTAIEQAFRRDLGLTYKLLRLVNSAAVGGREIREIGHAIRLVGRDTLQRWLSLLLVHSLANSGVDKEVAHISLTRARLGEQIAETCGSKGSIGPQYLVGLFSMLDALLGVPMPVVVKQLELSPEIASALTDRAGFAGETLALIERYEDGRWDDVIACCGKISISPEAVRPLYVDAIGWARAQMACVDADPQQRVA